MAKFYSVKQTAQILGYSTNSIYKFLDEGRLKSSRGNATQGRFKIPHSSLEAFLKSKLPEDAIHQALADEISTQTKKENGRVVKNPENTQKPVALAYSAKSLYLIRGLIIVGFILLLIDILFTDAFNLLHHSLRIILMIILILLSFNSPQALADESNA
jgi:hypothetical protein